MLENYSSQDHFPEVQGEAFDVSHFVGIVRRRIAYFVFPFVFVLAVGFVVISIQRPIYRAEGQVLVVSAEIPADLVRPTITELVGERVAVVTQRIMNKDNLVAVANRFDLLPGVRGSMSDRNLVDFMRSRTDIKPLILDVAGLNTSSNTSTAAFTLSFDYEDPVLAMKVASEFLTELLADDASRRTSNAVETTKFLDHEVNRLMGEHDAVIAQLEAARRRPPTRNQALSEEVKAQMKSLADLQAELVQKSSVYSDEHPVVKNLKKQIETLKRAMSQASQNAPAFEQVKEDVGSEVLDQKRTDLEKALQDANAKLTAARLGETLERNQQAEHFRILEEPTVPDQPVRPKKLKWLGVAVVLAGMIGAGSVFAAELFDGSIRRMQELLPMVDRQLIVTVPYLYAPGEVRQHRRKMIVAYMLLFSILVAGAVVLEINHTSFDLASLSKYWLQLNVSRS